jgi:hypothetical protein
VLVPVRQCRPEIGVLLLAAILLAAGILVYVFERGGTVYLLSSWTSAPPPTKYLGRLGNHLPTFLHTLAFILITAAILRPWPRLLLPTCATWLGIECLFELGQMAPFDGHIAALLPAWFKGVPVLEIASDYFTRGTYDALDIVSITLGATVAYPLVRIFLQGDKL